MGRTEEVIREMDKLAINVYRSNWWIRSNFVGSDTMPARHRADFKEALSTFRRLKRISLITKIGGNALLRLGGIGKILGGILHLRHHRDDGPSTDRSGKPAKTVIGPIIRGMILKINLMQNYSDNSVTANAVYCHRRVV